MLNVEPGPKTSIDYLTPPLIATMEFHRFAGICSMFAGSCYFALFSFMAIAILLADSGRFGLQWSLDEILEKQNIYILLASVLFFGMGSATRKGDLIAARAGRILALSNFVFLTATATVMIIRGIRDPLHGDDQAVENIEIAFVIVGGLGMLPLIVLYSLAVKSLSGRTHPPATPA